MNESNPHILILVGNEADEFFLNCLLAYYQENLSFKPVSNWEVFNIKGIKRRTQRIENKITPLLKEENETIKVVVFVFASKIDLYPFCEKPVIDWKIIENIVLNKNVHAFHEIGVHDLIEDWILDDLNGVCDFLGIDEPDDIEGANGYQKISKLFKKACRQYISSYSILDLLPFLDLGKIRSKRRSSLSVLENMLNVNN